MGIDIRTEVVIGRPRAAVAQFMFEPRNDAIWTTGLVEARCLEEGPLRKGSQVERISQFMGRRMNYLIEVVDHEPERFVEMLSTKPFEMHVRYELHDAGEGATRTAICAAGDGTGFFKLGAPILARMVKRQIGKDLQLLKAHLEGS